MDKKKKDPPKKEAPKLTLSNTVTEDKPRPITIVLIGPVASGTKTSLAHFFIKGEPDRNPGACAFPGFFPSFPYTVDGLPLLLDIWVLAGYRSCMTSAVMQFRMSDIVIAGFDVTMESDLRECDEWIECALRDSTCSVLVAVGNKIDLADKRVITTEKARRHYARRHPPIPYFETSALTGEGVKELFDSVLRMWLKTSAGQERLNSNQAG